MQRARTTIEEDAASDNNKALSFLLNRGADFDDVMQAHKNGNAKDMAKEIIDKRYRELNDRYNAATEGQKRFMKMTKDEAADFAKEAANKEIPPSLNAGSPLQHLVYELGMNEKPTMLSRDEYEKQAAESPYGKIYRGVRDNDLTGISSKDVIDSTATGDTTYLGNGLHSDGIYFAQNKATADNYAGNGAGTVMEATLNKDARIIDMDELSTMRTQDDVSLPNAGAYALYQGYNAIAVKNTDGNAYVIALDRSALAIPDDYIVKKAKREMPGAEIARAFNAFIPENRSKEGDTMKYEQKYEHITEIQEVEEVNKFNPWHDSMGRFASGPGGGGGKFSANPKTKAGQLAIARAHNNGLRTTFNSHKESKGENVYQNYRWINSSRGSFPGSRKKPGYTGTTSRNGLNARTNTFTSAKPVNYLNGTKITSKPSTATKPKTTSKPAASSQKPAASTNHKMANGKDIRKTFKYDSTRRASAVDQVAEQQGFKGKPQVAKDLNSFRAAAKASGVVMYRTINDGTDVVSGKRKNASQFIDDIKHSNKFSLNGNGGQAYGGGTYLAGNATVKKGTMPSKQEQDAARRNSLRYGYGTSQSKTAAMTFDPSAKIGKWDDVYNEFMSLSSSDRKKFGGDEGAYAAAKGYDALIKDRYGGEAYYMVYNRSKLIVFDETYDAVATSSFDPSINPVPVF